MQGFGENMIIEAHPSKSGGDWWYGKTVKDGKSGFFPQTYVQQVEQGANEMYSVPFVLLFTLSHTVKATAVYSYQGSSADELSFNEGDDLAIVDRLEADWWKAERDGFVYVVPAAYVEVTEG